MAEITNSQVTPNTTKLDRSHSRRNSTGKIVPPKNGEKILPRYLRASIGSCHDLCKYGRKDSFEEMKESHYIPTRVARKENGNHNSTELEISPLKKKTLVVKVKQSSPGSNTPLSTMPNNNSVQQVMKKTLGIPSSVGSNVLADMRKILGDKLKTSQSPKSPSRSHETMKKKVVLVSTKKLKLSSKQLPSKSKEKSPSAKSSTSLKLNSLIKTSSSSPVSSGNLNGNSDMKIGTSKVASKKVAMSPKPSLDRAASSNAKKHQSLKKDGCSSLMNQNKIMKAETEQSKVEQPRRDLVQEKTLYMIKMETENSTSEFDRNENCVNESMLPASSPQPEISSILNFPYSSSLKEIDERESGMMVYEEDKDSSDLKLKLRRGKDVDIQSENNSPRRIKYRRERRLLGDKQKVKEIVRRLSLKMNRARGCDDNKTISDAEKVVLRHQDVEGKKKQKMLNIVIKETASKLVQTRKGKVKALIGAFETLISLQDNPSANTEEL